MFALASFVVRCLLSVTGSLFAVCRLFFFVVRCRSWLFVVCGCLMFVVVCCSVSPVVVDAGRVCCLVCAVCCLWLVVWNCIFPLFFCVMSAVCYCF